MTAYLFIPPKLIEPSNLNLYNYKQNRVDRSNEIETETVY